MSSTKQYFPSIDGIRAIAVLSVVFFHIELIGFGGGFVGVDVFFVISGYLITRNIINQKRSNTFSFKRFYLSRFRRLFPAMLVTVAICILVGVLLFSPDALIRLSGSSIASLLSLANVRFWLVSNYFDIDSSLKPLLHFWSLSVEEQFYLVWPLLLFFLLRLNLSKAKTYIIIISLLLLSFSINQSLVNTDPSSAFYLAHLRAYEFLFGALLAYTDLNIRTTKDSKIKYRQSNLLFCIALLMLAYPIIFYSKQTLFPGYNSLLPCIATVLLILTKDSSLSTHFLANRVMVGIGKISYSLYLVHWPIWVYSSYWWFSEFSLLHKTVLLTLMFVSAYMLYKLVEQRFRYSKENSNDKTFLITIATFTILLLAVSWFMRAEGGLPMRLKLNYPELTASSARCEYLDARRDQSCSFGSTQNSTPKVLLIGDSHSFNLRYGLDFFGIRNNISFDSISSAGCAPIIDVELHYSSTSGVDSDCIEFSKKIKAKIEKAEYQSIIISARWMWYYEHGAYGLRNDLPRSYLAESSTAGYELNSETSRSVWLKQLTSMVRLIEKQGTKLVLLSQAPLLDKNIGECDQSPPYLIPSSQHKTRCQVKTSFNEIMDRLAFTNTTISSFDGPNIMVIKPSDYLCDRQTKTCHVWTDKGMLYSDDNHLSKRGSDFLIKAVEEQLADFLLSRG